MSRVLLSCMLAAGTLWTIAPSRVLAADPMSVTSPQPVRDPWVPPDARKPSTAAPSEGAALGAQVERKLRQAFDAADVSHTGSLTRQQASAAGLGFVARHFDEIDRQQSGAVRFDDVKRYMVEHGAKFD